MRKIFTLSLLIFIFLTANVFADFVPGQYFIYKNGGSKIYCKEGGGFEEYDSFDFDIYDIISVYPNIATYVNVKDNDNIDFQLVFLDINFTSSRNNLKSEGISDVVASDKNIEFNFDIASDLKQNGKEADFIDVHGSDGKHIIQKCVLHLVFKHSKK